MFARFNLVSLFFFSLFSAFFFLVFENMKKKKKKKKKEKKEKEKRRRRRTRTRTRTRRRSSTVVVVVVEVVQQEEQEQRTRRTADQLCMKTSRIKFRNPGFFRNSLEYVTIFEIGPLFLSFPPCHPICLPSSSITDHNFVFIVICSPPQLFLSQHNGEVDCRC